MPISPPKTFRRCARNILFRWVLTLPFVLFATGVTELVNYLTYRSEQTVVENLGQPLVAETNERVIQELKTYLQTPILVNRLNVDAVIYNRMANRSYYLRITPYQDQYGLNWQILAVIPASHFISAIKNNLHLTVFFCLLILGMAIGLGLFVTKLKQTEEALRDSQASLLYAQQIAHLGSWKVDLTTQETTWSEEFFRILGVDPNQAQPSFTDFIKLIPAEDRGTVIEAVRQMVIDGTPCDVEHRIQRSDGSIRYIISKGEAILDNQQQVVKLYGTVLDITDLRQAEVALQESEARFRQLAETVREGFFIFETTTSQYSYLNPACISISGMPTAPSQEDQDFFRGMTHWLNNIHPEDRDRIKAALQRERKGEDFREEYRFLRPNGELRWLQSKAFPIQNKAGEVIRIVGTVEDITDRKQLEQSLRSQAEEDRLLTTITQNLRQSLELEQILETTVVEVRQTLGADRVLIFRLNSDCSGQVIQEAVVPEYPVTAQMRWEDEHFPLACYEYYQQGSPRIVPDVATDEWADCLAEFLQEIGVKSKIVAPIVQTHGESVPKVWGLLVVHSCSHYHQWQASEANLLQQICNQLAIAIDQANLYQQLQSELIERKQTEEALRQSEELFRKAFDDAPIGISLVSRTGKFLRANAYYCNMLGYTEAELSVLNFQDITHPADLQVDLEGTQQVLIGNSSSFQMEKRYITKQGDIIPALMKTAPIRDQDGHILYFVGHIQDIRERLKVERLKDEFISIISHELRTPLTSIRGALGILESSVFDNQPEKAKHMLQIALNNSDRLVRLVNDILDLERLQSGKVQLVMQSCQASDLMQQAVEGVQAIADQFAITLALVPISVTLWAAPDAIVQTLTNLLSNAIKFSSPGGTVWLRAEMRGVDEWESDNKKPSHSITPSSQSFVPPSTPHLIFSVTDQGRGIPADKLEIIFEEFQQVDVSDARKKGGTGLGLAICKNIVQQHGGKIWAESWVSQGSTFYFTLPLRKDPEGKVLSPISPT